MTVEAGGKALGASIGAQGFFLLSPAYVLSAWVRRRATGRLFVGAVHFTRTDWGDSYPAWPNVSGCYLTVDTSAMIRSGGYSLEGPGGKVGAWPLFEYLWEETDCLSFSWGVYE